MKTSESQTITIRKAKAYDVSNLCRLLEQAYSDAEGMYPEPDQYMVINWVTGILSEGYCVVAEKAGRIIGSVAVTNYRFPWSPKWFIYVDWMYVSVGFREGGVFDGLLTAIHAYADERQAPIFGGISSGKAAALKDRLMRMKGYHYLGGQFMRDTEVQDGQRRQQEDDAEVHASNVHRGGRAAVGGPG
jgi:N-acetylglutamate synthase-like GNAT family acetyltransferase